MDKRGGEVQKATDDKDAMNVLLRSHGWALMMEFINGQIAVCRDQKASAGISLLKHAAADQVVGVGFPEAEDATELRDGVSLGRR